MKPESGEFTLEKMQVNTRLTTVETKLSGVENKLDVLIAETKLRNENDAKMLETLQSNVTALNHTVNGNGKPGLGEKVRKLEGLANHVLALWTGFLIFVLNGIKDWFIHAK